MLYHSVEKGLALPNPRLGFGRGKIRDLISSLHLYFDRYGADAQSIAALSSLEVYVDFHQPTNNEWIKEVVHGINDLREKVNIYGKVPEGRGGTRTVTRKQIWNDGRKDLRDFFASRYSVRQFASNSVSMQVIREAIRMAQKTPSVCNRQAGRVYVFDNNETGKEILACQNGNRGFGQQADKVLIITIELGAFLSVGERNQCWIDGGLYAMSLIYALHSLGLGTCCLNWSVEKDQDEKLRRVADIRTSENIVMLLAVGHLPERFEVAHSQREDVCDVAYFRVLDTSDLKMDSTLG
jgi:nitroreductase